MIHSTDRKPPRDRHHPPAKDRPGRCLDVVEAVQVEAVEPSVVNYSAEICLRRQSAGEVANDLDVAEAIRCKSGVNQV